MEIFTKNLIKVNYYALDKKSCLREIAEAMHKYGSVTDIKAFLDKIWEREKIMSTGIGHRIAIPHARSDAVESLQIAVYLLDNEIEFNSIDNKAVKIIFMIAVPKSMEEEYKKILSRISNFLRKEENRKKLLNCKNYECVYSNLKGLNDEIK